MANNKTGIIIAAIIINPPIVGVPDFCVCPSNPNSRMVSPICFLRIKLIIRFPNNKEITSEKIKANAALNEMY